MDLNLCEEVSNRSSLDLLLIPAGRDKDTELVKTVKESQPDNSFRGDILEKALIELNPFGDHYGLMPGINQAQIDYESLFSYLGRQAKVAERYESQEEGNSRNEDSSDSPALSEEEMRETTVKILVSCLTGSQENISPEEKESFTVRQMFNTSLFQLYRRLSPVSFQ